ncbi:MAG: amidohydrolase family protein, partial [Patescibacteria group bacterium]
MTKCDLAVKGKYVLPINSKLDIIKEGMVLISGNKIIDIGENCNLKEKYQAKEIIDAGNSIVMPGLINTHTHAAMTYFRGLADDLPLKEWLEKHIWP